MVVGSAVDITFTDPITGQTSIVSGSFQPVWGQTWEVPSGKIVGLHIRVVDQPQTPPPTPLSCGIFINNERATGQDGSSAGVADCYYLLRG